jgi:hypothetical protein
VIEQVLENLEMTTESSDRLLANLGQDTVRYLADCLCDMHLGIVFIQERAATASRMTLSIELDRINYNYKKNESCRRSLPRDIVR